MKQFTVEEIQNKFDNLPKELQTAISSPDVSGLIKAIADRHALQIDQFGELVDLVGLVLLGLVSSKDFVRELSKEGSISEDVSRAVAEDINREVFTKIRTFAREAEEKESPLLQTEGPKPTHIRDLEKAGGFTIEHESAPITLPKIPNFKKNIEAMSGTANNINSAIESQTKSITEPPVSLRPTVQNLVPDKEQKVVTDTIVQKETPKTEVIAKRMPEVAVQQRPKEIETPEVEVHKEPLADQLLGMLSKKSEKEEADDETEEVAGSMAPSNLPTEETIVKTEPVAPIIEESEAVEIPSTPISNVNEAATASIIATPTETAVPFVPSTPKTPNTPATPVVPKIPNTPPKSNWPDAYREPLE